MIEFEEYKSKLNDLKPKLEELRAAFVPQSLLDELERLHAMAEAPGFWDDPARSQKAVMRTKTLERKRDKFQSMCSEWDDLMTICEMALEENDDSMLEELTAGYAKLEADMEEARLETLLTGEYDANNALLSFHAGAGGTEAQDWCAMLYRMYTRWAERHGYTYQLMDYEAAHWFLFRSFPAFMPAWSVLDSVPEPSTLLWQKSLTITKMRSTIKLLLLSAFWNLPLLLFCPLSSE